MHSKQLIGKIGEDKATEYLKKNNYKIVERNFSCKIGEIDIIAKDRNVKLNNELVFFEVKTRSNLNYGRPAEAVNYEKRKHIYRVAKYYILKNNLCNNPIRFDVIEILIGKTCSINHIKQAF